MTALNKRICVGVIRLVGLSIIAVASCASLAQAQAQTDIEVLRSQLTLKEGETTMLTLFNAPGAPTSPVTITLTIEGSAEPFLSIDPAEITISAAGEVMTSITAVNNNDFAAIDPINIMLSIAGDNAQLTPTETIAVSIENDDIYIIGFEEEEVTLEEGASSTVRLSISPAPSGASTVAVALSVSDDEQLAAEPDEVVFSATSASFGVVVEITEDAIPESRQTFAVRLTPREDIPVRIGADLSVIVPADNDTTMVRVFAERSVIPEGTTASFLIDADINQNLTVNLAVSGLTGSQSHVSLSTSSLTLSPDKPSALFNILVADNSEAQAENRTFTVDLTTAFTPEPELPSLTLTIPPNDLTARAARRAEFTLKETERTITINITPELQGSKSFIVFSEDPRLIVKTGLITPDQSSFPVELALSEDTILGKEEQLSLSISHLDIWRQRSAQAQLSAGIQHSCGIRADGAVACWGDGGHGQTDPTSSSQGVNANTRFLAVSANGDHSCAIKADGTAACWGLGDSGQTDPTSSPQGVNANTRFLALSAGDQHSCGIRADGRVACWGNGSNGRTNPASAAGVNANTRFLAVSAGGVHSCGIKADGAVACWGGGGDGQTDPTSSPQGVDADTRFLTLSAGIQHSCGIKADSAAACWGDNDWDPSNLASAAGVNANTRFLAVSAGFFHTCGIKADSAVACWGLPDLGDLTSSPQGVDADTRFLALSAGFFHTCGIKADGAVACWGNGDDGQTDPPPGSFAQTLDVFSLAEQSPALATQDDGDPVQFNEVTGEVEVLHPQLALREGETTTLTLFKALSDLARPVTITLAVEENNRQFLSVSPTQLRISEEGGTATASIMAVDNNKFAIINPISIRLSISGDTTRLTPTETITVIIENDDVYTIGFDREEITLEEGMSATARLSITPTPPGADTVTVALPVSDNEQLAVSPEEVVFSAATVSFDVVVTVIEDTAPEQEDTFTVSLTPQKDIAAEIGAELSVIVPVDDDVIVRAMVERTILPEGTTASVFVDAVLNREMSVNLAVSGLRGAQSDASLSTSSLTLSPDNPSASFKVSVEDNSGAQADNKVFNVDLSVELTPQPELPSLTFTIPPNDLTAHAARRAEFTTKGLEQTLTISATPELQGSKSFIVFSEDPRLIVKTGLITPAQSSFPVELALNEDTALGEEELLSLSISHLDSWQPFAQPSAQAQLSAGGAHSCGIKEDNAVACWGFGDDGRTDPTSGPQGVDANTRFLAVSAGGNHSCGIKADSAVACWGDNDRDRSNPASAAGVNANTRFLAVSAGHSHSCGIKADSAVACWGNDGNNRADPASAAGVDADTRFLALSAGEAHTCGIRADGRMACWGSNGSNRANPKSSPHGVDADTRFLAVSAGVFHSCGVKADGRVACWGFNGNNRANPASAAGVDADTRFLALSAGDFHGCGVKADGRVACWGFNGNGQTSSGVDADTRFLAVSAGSRHSCGIQADGKVACWGFNRSGQAGPPSLNFSRTPDVFRLSEQSSTLATQDGGKPVHFNEVTEVEVLHPQLTLNEGEAATLTLFKALSDLTTPLTITLAIEEPDERFLSVSSTQLTLSEKGGTATASIMAVDNDEFAIIDPISIRLSISGDNTRLTPTETITVIVENDEVYTIGFDREEITLEEGMSATARLSIDPTPSGADAATVILSVSDNEQLTVSPEEVVFSATSASFDVVVAVIEDTTPEPKDTFTVSLTPSTNTPAVISSELSVMVPADDDIIVRAIVERTILPEGTAASVFVDAVLNREMSVSLAVSGLRGAQSHVILTPPSLTLSPDKPSASFNISVADNEEPQGSGRMFAVDLSVELTPQPELPSLTFTIPPNDLTAHAARRAEFTLENKEAAQTMTINITPELQDSKSFLIFSEDPRLMVKTGLITPAQSPFPVELALSEDTVLGREERLNLSIIHLDSWQPFTQASAQAQLSAGNQHSCGIRADGRMACWGHNGSDRANPASAAGVNADTRFLAVSAGNQHSCAIRADSAVACWGDDLFGRTDLTSGLQGVNANTRFLAVSAGGFHSCGIKTDSTMACWGFNSIDQINPASAAGVDADTRFLAVSAGNQHSCGIRADGRVACWGHNGSNRANPASAAGVDADTRFLALSAGEAHTCGIKADGRVACWGHNESNRANPASAAGVNADTRFLALSAHRFHSCGIQADGRVACWGFNGNGEASPASAADVDADTRFLAVSAGRFHSCGIKADGRVACWGNNSFGQGSRPSDSFSRTPDVFRLSEQSSTLATQDGGKPVHFNEVTEVEVLHPQLTLNEGEAATLTLFKALSDLTTPLTISLAIEEPDERFLSVSSTQLTLSEKGGTATASIMAVDNDEFAIIDPISIRLSISGDNTRLTPTETITVIVENDEVYTIGFDREEITLEEGMSATARLSIDPTPSGADAATVILSVSDNEQLTVSPEEVVFSATSASFDVVVDITEDSIPETEDTFTVSLTPSANTPAVISSELSVMVPADSDTPIVRVRVERTVIPEGTTASVFIDAVLNRDLSVNLAVSGLVGAQSEASLSSSSLTLSVDEPSASFSVSIVDNKEPQGSDRIANVDLSTEFTPSPELPSLAFTIPPNDLTAHAARRAEFKIEEPEQAVEINVTPPLQDSKSFIVFSDDPRLMVKTGLITPAQSPFSIELALSEDTVLGRKEQLSLGIIYLDSWQPFAQASAQAQLGAGTAHSCGIKADSAVACWGFGDDGQTDPTSSPQGVDANTRFLAVSAGNQHSCGIRADGRVACWGHNGSNRANPASAAGVDANTRFLAVSAGGAHSCGIKADSTVACWGFGDNGRTDPTSSPQGVDANTRFLAVSAGNQHSCGIKADSAVACWGLGDDGRTDPTSSPQGVDANTRFLAVSAGTFHSCGIRADGRVACWGDDSFNQINPASAAGVDANTRFLAISAGGAHNCGIKADGAVACWGDVGFNQINPASAAGVDVNSRFLALSAGHLHTCGIKADGAVACWGYNFSGQSNPPSDSFARTPDVFSLAEQSTTLATEDGGKPVQFNEVTDVGVLPDLGLGEGDATTPTLLRVLSGMASPLTITLAIGESEKRLLTIPEELILTATERESGATITAPDNDDYAYIDPIHVRLSISGDNARLTPTETITVTIENDDFYTIGFEGEALTLEEGGSATVRLSIDPAPANAVTVGLSASDERQLAVASSATFATNTTNTHAGVSAIDDADKEKEQEYAIRLIIPSEVPADMMGTDMLRVTVLPDERDSSIVVTVEPTNLRLMTGRAERIRFAVPERFLFTGPTTIRLTAEGDITVTPRLIVLSEEKRAEAARVKATLSPGDLDAAMGPRSAAISLSVTGANEDPRLSPDNIIRILIEESSGIKLKVRVYLEGALP